MILLDMFIIRDITRTEKKRMIMSIIYHKDEKFLPQLQNALDNHQRLTNWSLFSLLYTYKKTSTITSFNQLQSLEHLRHVTFLDHQVDAANKVINDMNGRAILADEVGLGKTIEAGLILKEYLFRRLVKRVLILVPSSLVNQWVQELSEKFYIQTTIYRKNYRWDEHPIMICSIDLAKRSPHREEINKLDYDLIIVDEAHRLKNRNTLNYKFVQAIKKKYCLLLTATPIQNDLLELFNLVSIIKPGLLGNYTNFKKKYRNPTAKDKQYLHHLIQKIMVRNRRKDTILDDVKRKINTVWLEFSAEEQQLYDRLSNTLQQTAAFSKLTYLKELCSSREACYVSLQKREPDHLQDDISELIEEIASLPHHIKAKKLVETIQNIGSKKVIVFTQYRASQYYLQWYLQQHQISAITFSGGLKPGRKDWITNLFKEHYQVLIATEAGGEGINLQFCHHIINYDLPWNPMHVEQRIGRIHRYGQKHHVNIYNFAIKNTLEEHVVHLLYEKIHVFENVIGELDSILEKLNIENVDREMEDIINRSDSVGEARIKLNHLFHVIENATTNEGVN